MTTSQWRLRGLLLAMSIAVGSCVDRSERLAGKPCEGDSDCPAGFTCPDAGKEQPRICVARFVIPEMARAGDPAVPADAGVEGGVAARSPEPASDDGAVARPVPFYCTEIKPILDAYCVSCHGATPAEDAPTNFRLDVYETTTVPGAFAKAWRVMVRTWTTTSMPPQSAPQPTSEQRDAVAAWAFAGAPECVGKPVPSEGAPDGGVNSVGYVSGEVSYSKHIQPLWDAYCVSCHDDPVGGAAMLDLREGASYAALMQRSVVDEVFHRVVPGSTSASLLWIAIYGGEPDLIGPMPRDSPGLRKIAPFDFRVIELWLEQGAKEN